MSYTSLLLPSVSAQIGYREVHVIHLLTSSLSAPAQAGYREYMSHTSILTILYDGLCTSVVKDLTVVNANATANC